ncbi:hypothetical protein HaLaN_17179, partial [Haematococcus lacustris]
MDRTAASGCHRCLTTDILVMVRKTT